MSKDGQTILEHINSVLKDYEEHGGIGWGEDVYRLALAALTQPASPALKLPDGWVAVPLEPSREMRLASKRYKSKTKLPTGPSVYKAMVAAAPAAPHTAPIEPICSTGGAEWTVNSLANDALIMLDRIDTSDSTDDDRIEEVKRIVRLLAAAPEGK